MTFFRILRLLSKEFTYSRWMFWLDLCEVAYMMVLLSVCTVVGLGL